MLRRWSRVRAGALLAVCAAISAGAWATGFDDFSLSKLVPADATIVVNSREHAGQAFIAKQWERIGQEIEKQHFDRDLRKLIRLAAENGDANLDEFDTQWQQISDLITAVDWSALSKREMAWAMRFPKMVKGGADLPIPEFVFLTRPAPDKVAECYDALAGMLKAAQKMSETEGASGLTLSEDKQGDLQIYKLSFPPPVPFGVTLARHKETLLIGFGSGWIEQVLSQLSKPGASVVASDRFKAAFKSLPAPTDEFAFVDLARIMEFSRAAIAMAGEGAPDNPMTKMAKLIDLVDMYETVASVATTDGMKTTTDTLTVLRADAAKSSMYSAVYGQPPVKDPLKYVPKAAQGVWVGSGVDLVKVYDALMAFAKEVAPPEEDPTAHVEALETQMGFKIKEDLLEWAQGAYVMFTVPGPQAFSQAETVFMVKAKDEKKAKEFVDRLFAMVEPMLQGQGGTVEEVELDGATGFKSVMHPMLGMLGGLSKPTLGVKDGFLFFGSSPKGLKEAFNVAGGKSDNFTKSERFIAEGLAVDKPLHHLGFEDLTNWGPNLGQAILMAARMPAMLGAGKSIPQPVVSIATKIGSVLSKIDFYSSSAETARLDGRNYIEHAVITYREPPAAKPDKKSGETEPKAKDAKDKPDATKPKP